MRPSARGEYYSTVVHQIEKKTQNAEARRYCTVLYCVLLATTSCGLFIAAGWLAGESAMPHEAKAPKPKLNRRIFVLVE